MYQVLLVDDEALIREAVSENILWEKLGYELIASCENGKQAKEYLQTHKVDLVITDICMPYMDGLELSCYLHNESPQIEIIILSGYDDFDYAKQAIKYRVSEYLLKPITASELSEVLIKMHEKLDKQNLKNEQLVKLNNTYHRNKLLMKANALVDLFLGNKSIEESEKQLKEVGVILQAAAYRTAIVEIDIYSGNRFMDEKTKRESALMAFVTYNVANEIVIKAQAGEVCQGTDQRTLILFTTNKPKEFEQTVHQICKEIQAHLNKIMGMDITISIGKYVNEVNHIYQSFTDAKEVLEYRYILGTNKIIDRIVIEDEIKPWTSVQGEIKNLLLCIKKNDKKQMQEFLSDFEMHMKRAILSRHKICIYLQQIVEEIGELLGNLDMTEVPVYLEKEQIINSIYETENFADTITILNNYCSEAAESIDNEKNVGGKKYALMAMDFIEKNYADSQINLNSICNYLNISTSRFSSIFKKAIGETFMEVLIRLRMEKAKELLKNTDFKNYEIAEKVGFSDPHYFSVVFKKMTGRTPSEYAREEG